MKSLAAQSRGRGVVELIEEAVHLLRTAPVTVLVPWLTGTLPFVLALLFFWSDMSAGAFASDRLAAASLGVSAAFIWMKYWHARFAVKVRALAATREAPVLTAGMHARMLAVQSVIHAAGLFILPLAAVSVLPFPWVYAFFQSVTAGADGRKGLRATLHVAARQAADIPMRNIRLLLLMAAFALFVFLNWVILGFALPDLVRMLSGYDSRLTLNMFAILNSTFLAVVCSLTFLCLDPILKTIYVLRCFYNESVRSGEDLLSELRQLKSGALALPLALAIVCCAGTLQAAPAAEGAPATAVEEVSTPPAQLEQAIMQVLEQSKYSWRSPRVRESEAGDNVIVKFLKDGLRFVADALRDFRDWLGDLLDKLFPRKTRGENSGLSWMLSSQFLLGVLLAAVVAILIIVLMRWKRSRLQITRAEALPAQPVPDLTDENLGADHLPEDGWVRLGRELLAKGEYRLALRAFYLSSLALLAERRLITLARFKSNRDYERELRRRAHQLPDLLQVFSGNVSVFEQAWYGRMDLDADLVRRFAESVQRMRAGA
jgi:hypothetical protein